MESNYVELPPEEWSTELLQIPDFETSEQPTLYFDYPMRYGGTLSNEPPQRGGEEDENSFAIGTSASDAQAAIDNRAAAEEAASRAPALPEVQAPPVETPP